MTWKLQTISGEFTGKEVSIERDMLVGRHQDADLSLQSADVSRRHAALLLKHDELWVQDLKSSNGTFINNVRVEDETLLRNGDILQFASQRFSVLEPAKSIEEIHADANVISDKPIEAEPVQQPSEAIAVSETAQEKTVAEKMNDQGMPELVERDQDVQVTPEGMPKNVGIPKPAPIPEGVNIQANAEPKPIPVEQSESRVEQALEQQKNASVGLFSLIALIIVAIIAWLIFK